MNRLSEMSITEIKQMFSLWEKSNKRVENGES